MATDVELPVLPDAPRSTMGRRRAVALVLVHLLVLAHLLHWWWRGSTMTPVEPSEGSISITTGAVNAGAIFLVAVILSTLLFGRFFCGWACHLVAYQDGCRWLLMKLGLRPKPVRSRLLLFVPLFAASWLYVVPFIDHWRDDEPAPGLSWHLTTDAFWATFPGFTIGALTFIVCGFLIVYVLGAKGFCTYGCPYGGLFAIADRFTVGRIRVTDACDGSAQCTLNCSSNVNVAKEVREHGMVIDPGCMKCMDCISVCPNDALYFGYGSRDANAPEKGKDRPRRLPRGHRLGFLFSAPAVIALVLGIGFAVTFRNDWTAGIIAASVLAIGAAAWVIARPRAASTAPDATPRHDFSLAEETFMAAAFIVAFAVVYDLYRSVPLLMAIGVASIIAYLLVLPLRLARRPRVRMQNLLLKSDRRLRPAGAAVIAIAAGLIASLIFGGLLQWNTREAVADFQRAEYARFVGNEHDFPSIAAKTEAHLAWCDRYGVLPTRGLGRMMGELQRWSGRPEAALNWYAREDLATARNLELPMLAGLAHWSTGETETARSLFARSLERSSTPRDRFLKLNWELRRLGATAERIEVLRSAQERFPADGAIALNLCTLLVRADDPGLRDPDEAFEIAEGICAANDRSDAELLGLLAWLYDQRGRSADAVAAALDSQAAARRAGDELLAGQMGAMADQYRRNAPR